MAIFWLTTTNTIIIFWVQSHAESIEWFRIMLLTFYCYFELFTLFCCSWPNQTCGNHYHHPNIDFFFQLAKAAFCGRNQYILAPMLTLEWSHASALNLKKKTISDEDKGITGGHCLSPHPCQGDQDSEDFPRGLPATQQLSNGKTSFLETDSTTALSYIAKEGGTHFLILLEIMTEILVFRRAIGA